MLGLLFASSIPIAHADQTLVCIQRLAADRVEALVFFGSASACAQPGRDPATQADVGWLYQNSREWCEIQRGGATLLYFAADAFTEASPDGVLGPDGVRLAAIEHCSGLEQGIDFERMNGVDSSAPTHVLEFFD